MCVIGIEMFVLKVYMVDVVVYRLDEIVRDLCYKMFIYLGDFVWYCIFFCNKDCNWDNVLLYYFFVNDLVLELGYGYY